jgi:predicted lipoprotein with Yx(FWY)xxD motif
MKKVLLYLGSIIIVLAVILGGYKLLYKSNKAAPATANSSYSSTTSTSSSSNTSATTPAVNNAVLVTKTNSTIGNYLADPNGNTLYTDGSGDAGVTNCSSSCLSAWPVYQDKGATTGLPANVSTIKRSDNGQIQYTYKGAPLYYFTSDTSGQVTGNGVSGFYVAKP